MDIDTTDITEAERLQLRRQSLLEIIAMAADEIRRIDDGLRGEPCRDLAAHAAISGETN